MELMLFVIAGELRVAYLTVDRDPGSGEPKWKPLLMREKKPDAELLRMVKELLVDDPACSDAKLGLTRGDLNGANWTVFMVRNGPTMSPCFDRALAAGRRIAAQYDMAGTGPLPRTKVELATLVETAYGGPLEVVILSDQMFGWDARVITGALRDAATIQSEVDALVAKLRLLYSLES